MGDGVTDGAAVSAHVANPLLDLAIGHLLRSSDYAVSWFYVVKAHPCGPGRAVGS